jgi:hypothetical protein
VSLTRPHSAANVSSNGNSQFRSSSNSRSSGVLQLNDDVSGELMTLASALDAPLSTARSGRGSVVRGRADNRQTGNANQPQRSSQQQQYQQQPQHLRQQQFQQQQQQQRQQRLPQQRQHQQHQQQQQRQRGDSSCMSEEDSDMDSRYTGDGYVPNTRFDLNRLSGRAVHDGMFIDTGDPEHDAVYDDDCDSGSAFMHTHDHSFGCSEFDAGLAGYSRAQLFHANNTNNSHMNVNYMHSAHYHYDNDNDNDSEEQDDDECESCSDESSGSQLYEGTQQQQQQYQQQRRLQQRQQQRQQQQQQPRQQTRRRPQRPQQQQQQQRSRASRRPDRARGRGRRR